MLVFSIHLKILVLGKWGIICEADNLKEDETKLEIISATS